MFTIIFVRNKQHLRRVEQKHTDVKETRFQSELNKRQREGKRKSRTNIVIIIVKNLMIRKFFLVQQNVKIYLSVLLQFSYHYKVKLQQKIPFVDNG